MQTLRPMNDIGTIRQSVNVLMWNHASSIKFLVTRQLHARKKGYILRIARDLPCVQPHYPKPSIDLKPTRLISLLKARGNGQGRLIRRIMTIFRVSFRGKDCNLQTVENLFGLRCDIPANRETLKYANCM